MDKDTRLPSRATEQGIELISLDNGLDLIRKWLPDAPTSVRITRISHQFCGDEHKFTISCVYPPMESCNTECCRELNRGIAAWRQHVEALELPTLTWIDSREVRLHWWPQSFTPRSLLEYPIDERIQDDFFYLAEQAICIWQLLRGKDAESFRKTFGGFAATLSNIADLPPFASSYGYLFTQQTLDDSILSAPCDWLYVLALAESTGTDTPLTRDFPKAFLRLQSSPFPDLSDLAAAIEPFSGDHPEEPLTPEQNIRASETFALASQFLDGFLSHRLEDVNHLLRACEATGEYPPDQ